MGGSGERESFGHLCPSSLFSLSVSVSFSPEKRPLLPSPFLFSSFLSSQCGDRRESGKVGRSEKEEDEKKK